MAPDTFPNFLQLPIEVQTQIWQLTGGWEVFIRMQEYPDYAREDCEEQHHVLLESGQMMYATRPWPALHSCCQAREALSPFLIPPTRSTIPFPSWLDWTTAWIVLRDSDTEYLTRCTDWSTKIVNLVLLGCSENMFQNMFIATPTMTILSNSLFPHVENLFISIHEYYDAMKIKTIVYLDCAWFDIIQELYSYDMPANFRIQVGGPTIPEQSWLTPENYTQQKYWTGDFEDLSDEEEQDLPSFTENFDLGLKKPILKKQPDGSTEWVLRLCDRFPPTADDDY